MPKQFALDIPFPVKGLDESQGYGKQPPGTTVACQNVRAFDPSTGRLRGGSRAGLSKYLNAQHSEGAVRIQCLDHVTIATGTPSATQIAVRDVIAICVANGVITKFTSSAFTNATNASGNLSATAPAIFCADLFQEVFFCDGSNYKVYDPVTNTVTEWTTAAREAEDGDDGGEMPVHGVNKGRLIETWRSRIVISGIKTDPHNWFMSAAGYPYDFNYGPTETCEIQAVAGNNSSAGEIGDIINTMIPYSDDLLIFGCDHSIWMMRGDPMAGGRIDLLTDVIGMSWGRPWCKDALGLVYFFGSRGGVFRMAPGSLPQRISGPIEERLASVNLNTSIVRMAWNDREQGVHVFISPLTTGATTHYFYDTRSEAWWPDVFANTSHNPVAVDVYDGDAVSDRVMLLGGQDGRVYKWNVSGTDDDGTAISSHVRFGPFQLSGGLDRAILTEIQAVLGTGSESVTLEVFTGDSAQEAAASSTAYFSRTLAAGRNLPETRRATGQSFYLKLSQNALASNWSLESLIARLRTVGHSYSRGY